MIWLREEFLLDKLSKMSLWEKIGQMIMIDYRNLCDLNKEFERLLIKYNPGGFILFKSNIDNYKQTKKLINDIKNIGNIKSIVAVDQEGGRVQRLDERVDFRRYPAMMEVGLTNNKDMAFQIGMQMGNELQELGIDINMAPVLDIFSNIENRVIGDRAFGCDSEMVSRMALAYVDGLRESNVLAIGKHFPGHGDTVVDSHIDLPILNKTLDELKLLELIPFREAIKKNIFGIMMGHIAVPRITNEKIPASLSKIMINDLLRNNMGYYGVIMTDSLKMKALTKYFTDEEIYLMSVMAGNDILVMPRDIEKIYEVIYQGVNEGKITEKRINDSVFRILGMKFDRGIFEREYLEFIKMKEEERCILDMKQKIRVRK